MFSGLKQYQSLWIIGSLICFGGEVLRKCAMITASHNFTHVVQFERVQVRHLSSMPDLKSTRVYFLEPSTRHTRRILSDATSCVCWLVLLGYRDSTNPDKSRLFCDLHSCFMEILSRSLFHGRNHTVELFRRRLLPVSATRANWAALYKRLQDELMSRSGNDNQ